MTACVIYAAKSTEDVHGSIPGQIEACRAHAEREGWEVAGAHADEASSGFSGSRGPGLIAAKEQAAALAANGYDAVLLVAVSDRLARGDGKRARHLGQHWFDAQEDGYRLASVSENLGDIMYAVILGERAHLDSAAKSAHVKRGLLAAAQRGRKKGGGQRPYGYMREFDHLDAKGGAIRVLKPDPAEATVVRRVFDEIEAGRSQTQVARGLNADGITTVTGKSWSQSQVQQMLQNRLYVGQVLLNGQHYSGEHESIITVEQFERVRTALSGRYGARKGGRPTLGSHVLVGGSLKCVCSASMRPRAEQKRDHVWEAYICAGRHEGSTGCTLKAIPAHVIDTSVLAYFTRWALDLDAMVRQAEEARELQLADTRLALTEAEAEAASAAQRLARVKRAFQDGHLEASDWSAQRVELAAELDAANAALESLREREAGMRAVTFSDAEQETLERLAGLRSAVSREVAVNRDDLEALRATLARVFESFQLHISKAGEMTLMPRVRPEFLEPPRPVEIVDTEEWAQLVANDEEWAQREVFVEDIKRLPIELSRGGQPNSSRR